MAVFKVIERVTRSMTLAMCFMQYFYNEIDSIGKEESNCFVWTMEKLKEGK